MKHDVRDFPFRIADVASLMGFYVPSGRTSQTYDCIFCGKSKKLNINFSKNVYGCNYCGAGGGMVALYADYYNLTPKEAYDEICEGLHLKPEQKASFRAPAVKPSKMDLLLTESLLRLCAGRSIIICGMCVEWMENTGDGWNWSWCMQ